MYRDGASDAPVLAGGLKQFHIMQSRSRSVRGKKNAQPRWVLLLAVVLGLAAAQPDPSSL